jgi:hypothetical protein
MLYIGRHVTPARSFVRAGVSLGDVGTCSRRSPQPLSQMDADAKLDAALGRKSGVTLNRTILHLDGAAQSVNYANSTRLPSPVTSFLKAVAPCLTISAALSPKSVASGHEVRGLVRSTEKEQENEQEKIPLLKARGPSRAGIGRVRLCHRLVGRLHWQTQRIPQMSNAEVVSTQISYWCLVAMYDPRNYLSETQASI